MKFEKLGDWCKWLEKNFSPDIMIPTLPVIIRLDGNNFSKWTKGLKKPFDEDLTELMTLTTEFLVKETNAIVGYTQSDEITLILYSDSKESSIYNDGKKQKILSKLSAKCTAFFNEKRLELLPNHNKTAIFDCRIYQTPTLHDAVTQLLWRENDAIKNSISMLAQSEFSHTSLQGKKSYEMKEMLLKEKKINWESLEDSKRKGTYIVKKVVESIVSKEELNLLPEKHEARKNPNLKIKRSVILRPNIPVLSERSSNERVKIFFS